jgi:hypothetical protein
VAPLVIVDAANVVGSKPDGWWRDREGAARRLRDSLATLPGNGLPGLPPPVDVVLVVEGAARGIAAEDSPIRVLAADGSGDDTIVELVAAAGDRPTTVVTADRGLRERVQALGADVVGPRTVRP